MIGFSLSLQSIHSYALASDAKLSRLLGSWRIVPFLAGCRTSTSTCATLSPSEEKRLCSRKCAEYLCSSIGVSSLPSACSGAGVALPPAYMSVAPF